MKKIIALLLGIVCLFSVACQTNDSSSSNPSDGSSEQTWEGTGNYIVRNGKNTGYKIVTPTEKSGDIDTAVSEFNLFFEEATGVKLTVIDESKATWNDTAKYISIGNTSLMQSAGVTLANDLGTSGTQVVTKSQSLFLTGETDLGALYAVYDFLHLALNWEYYYADCYSLDKNVSDLELCAYDFTNVPDIEYRSTSYGYQVNDPLVANRMRLKYYFDPFLMIGPGAVHNSLAYVQGKDSGHESYWYSADGTQLCYTARGNEAEYEAMQQACFTTLKSALIQDTKKTVATLTIQDVNTFCACNACAEVKSVYGANSACVILFMNDLRALVDAWFLTDEGKPYARDLELLFFAYYSTVEAPVTYDEATDTFTPNNGIACADGVSVFYAPIEADYTKSIYDVANKSVYNTMRTWSTISKKFYLWTYNTVFTNYMIWYYTFNGMQDWYKAAKEINTSYHFNQAQYNVMEGSYAWGSLKSYLNAKLAWDVDANMEELINNWFDNYFGPASEEMFSLFKKERVHINYLINNVSGYSGGRSVQNRIDNKKFWPKAVLLDWLEETNEIIDTKLLPLKSNRALYDAYYYRIAQERLSILFCLIDFYDFNTSKEDMDSYKWQFYYDATAIGLDNTGEGASSLPERYIEWGLV